MEQFADPRTARISWDNCAIGLIFFRLDWQKTFLLADPLGNITSPIFSAAEHGPLSFASAWVATITYTFQLYFDFSGYSDMAVGLSLLFGVRIPVNFLSPYKATSMIEFWRRWHISLSSFLRDYLYIPLGGNRDGPLRRYINLFLTMLLGGLWHGASWNFVIWGGLHETLLLWNHAWRSLIRYDIGSWPGRVLTFLAVMIAWVFFRATDLDRPDGSLMA